MPAPPPVLRARMLGESPGESSSRSGLPVVPFLVALIGAAICGYHGFRRNGGSATWAIVWGGAGFWCPVVAVPFALSQGLGRRA